ncbi:MAG: response regulator transcription factor [Chloroflexota bacterium]
MDKHTLLIVEDEPQAAQMLEMYLEAAGYALVVAQDGPTGETLFNQVSPSLVVLDIMLPGFDGVELCRRIRANSTTPIIMLTARAQEVEKAVGLGAGADDYVTKPYSPLELIARIKAQLRRAYDYQEPINSNPTLLGGPRLLLDPNKHGVTLDGTPVVLTLLEFKVLEVLMTNPGWAFSRSHLLEKVWGYDEEAGEDTVTVHVSNLRKKLGSDGEILVKTIRGVGYAYQED